MTAYHTIGVVSRRTGLSTHLIRIWERRYGAVKPVRTETNRRLYSDEDIQRLSLLYKATQDGESISQIARLSLEELKELIDSAGAMMMTPTHASSKDSLDTSAALTAEQYYDECVKAVVNLDAAGLETTLARALVSLSKPVLLEKVIEPLMYTVGDMWLDGSIKVLHEHQASAVIRTFLGNLASPIKAPPTAPKIISATPAGQMHEFGALITTVISAFDGWNAIYIGRNTPTEDIVSAANQKGVKALALSIVYPADDPVLARELIRLKGLLNDNVALLIGGRAASGYVKTLRQIGAVMPRSMTELRTILGKIRASNHSAVS